MKPGRGSSRDANVWPQAPPTALIHAVRVVRFMYSWGNGEAWVSATCVQRLPRPHAYITGMWKWWNAPPGSPGQNCHADWSPTLTTCNHFSAGNRLRRPPPAAPHFPAICPAGGRNNPWIPGLITGEWVLPSCGLLPRRDSPTCFSKWSDRIHPWNLLIEDFFRGFLLFNRFYKNRSVWTLIFDRDGLLFR